MLFSTIIILILQMKNFNLRRLSNLPKFTQLRSGKVRIKNQVFPSLQSVQLQLNAPVFQSSRKDYVLINEGWVQI